MKLSSDSPKDVKGRYGDTKRISPEKSILKTHQEKRKTYFKVMHIFV